MPFDWSKYLRLAEELATRKEEACLRSSLSRMYYYVYNIALERAKRNGFKAVSGESTHGQLWRLYSKSPEPRCVSLGQIALRLKEKREKADYDPSFLRIEEEVPLALQDALYFADILQKLAQRFPDPESVRR